MQPLQVGDLAPWFAAATRSQARFLFNTVAGRHVLLCFPGDLDATGLALIATLTGGGARFDDRRVCFFGVLDRMPGAHAAALDDRIPGIRFFLDADGAVGALYGAIAADGRRRRIAFLLDPALRVSAVADLEAQPVAAVTALLSCIDRLPPPAPLTPARMQAPVLQVPDVFEPALCRRLIDYYEATGAIDSGFMREVDGLTVGMIDHAHKRRRDCLIEDETLRRACMLRIHDRLLPQIERAFQFRATRMERYVVSCYDAAERGRFRAHRDNTTRGTAHRRFAVSLFLNDGFEGGQLVFPEFGRVAHRAPVGSAVVFSCSLLHEALPVTAGRRYMFLPFLYDEAARRQRTENERYLGGDARQADGEPPASGLPAATSQ